MPGLLSGFSSLSDRESICAWLQQRYHALRAQMLSPAELLRCFFAKLSISSSGLIQLPSPFHFARFPFDLLKEARCIKSLQNQESGRFETCALQELVIHDSPWSCAMTVVFSPGAFPVSNSLFTVILWLSMCIWQMARFTRLPPKPLFEVSVPLSGLLPSCQHPQITMPI